MKRGATLLALVLLVGGCGGGDGGDDGGGGGANPASYDAAYDICAGGLQTTADLYGVPPTREAVTAAVAEQVSGGQPDDADVAARACGDALDGKPRQDG